jgi:DNA-binding response OmpR family regulator
MGSPAFRFDITPAVPSVLTVSPWRDDHQSLSTILSNSIRDLSWAGSIADAMYQAAGKSVPIVVCEHQLSDGAWNVLFQKLERMPKPPKLIVASRLADEKLWSEVLNLGGWDVLAKPFELREVLHVVRHAWESWYKQWGSLPKTACGTEPRGGTVARTAA